MTDNKPQSRDSNEDAGLCRSCHWWFHFDESHITGDCVWHTGTKNTKASKLRFKGILKTQADFGCVCWERDRKNCPVCKQPKTDCRCDQQEAGSVEES